MRSISTASLGLSFADAFGRAKFWPYVILAVLAFVVYARGLGNGLVAEDYANILDTKVSFEQIGHYIVNSVRVRPVVFLFQWVVTALFDSNPIGLHAVILALYITTALLMYQVMSKITGERLLGFIGALIFVLYPRNHQVVLWYSANQFVLLALFCLLTLALMYEYLLRRYLMWLLLTTLGYSLMLFTLESAAVIGGLMVLFDLFIHPRSEGLKALLRLRFYLKYVPFLLVLMLHLVISFGGARSFKLTGEGVKDQVNRFVSVGEAGETYHFTGLGMTQVKDFAAYTTYALFPHVPLRSLEPSDPLSLVLVVSTVVLVIGLLVLGDRLTHFGLVWIAFWLLPVVLFVPFGNADRYFLLPAIGFSMITTSLTHRLYNWLRNRRPSSATTVSVSLVGLYLLSSILLIQMRIDEWRRAGEIATDVVGQMLDIFPKPLSDSTVLFVDIPGEYRQAYVFVGGGIGSAVLLAYGESDRSSNMDIYQTRDPEVSQYLKRAEPVEHPLDSVYVLQYVDGVLVNKSGVVDDVEVLKASAWAR